MDRYRVSDTKSPTVAVCKVIVPFRQFQRYVVALMGKGVQEDLGMIFWPVRVHPLGDTLHSEILEMDSSMFVPDNGVWLYSKALGVFQIIRS